MREDRVAFRVPTKPLAACTPQFSAKAKGAAALHPKTKEERKTDEPEKTLTVAELEQFTGSEHWYRHGINRKVLFTDGAKYVCGAYWLLDEIVLIQPYDARVAAEEFRCGR